MDQIKVLVVDDSSLMRKLITNMVEKDEEVKVIDTALNGIFALKKIEKRDPDVILLDIEMPEMNGVEFLEKARELKIDIPIIILSSLGKNRPELTLKCLDMGAKDFIIKPSGTISLDIELVQEEVISKIKYFYREHPRHKVDKKELKTAIEKIDKTKEPLIVEPITLPEKKEETPKKDIVTNIHEKVESLNRLDILAIGISTGGPYALRKILPLFPSTFPLPIVIVQHMPSGFTNEFANGLNEICKLQVKEAEENDLIERGKIYISPGDKHLKVKRLDHHSVLHLSDEEAINGHKPSVEALFDSILDHYGKHIISIIMTGMGKDGARAIRRIRQNGGITFAQSEETCVVFGMPKVAIELDGIDEVINLDDIPKRIMEVTSMIMS